MSVLVHAGAVIIRGSRYVTEIQFAKEELAGDEPEA